MSEPLPPTKDKAPPETHRENSGGHPTGEKLATEQPKDDP